MADLKNVIYLSNEDYATLVSTGTVTIGGDTLIYDETNNIYVTPEETASATNDGLMSAADKVKLDGIASGAEVNVQSDWNVTDSSSDAFIKNKPTIPTVNNGTLTIQKNGASIATFSANQSTAVTANITVPTTLDEISDGSTRKLADYLLKTAKAADSDKLDGHDSSYFQTALSTQTAYSAAGSATKVPQITTNNLGQVTGITEVAITDHNDNQTVKVGSTTFTANAVVSFTGSGAASVSANSSSNTITITVPTVTDTNYYHSTGSWNGLTYTAANNGGAPTLSFTIPTGTSATSVAVGNHTHGYYTKPSGGIPGSDLAENYYIKPTGGIPSSDLAETYVLASSVGTAASKNYTTTVASGNTDVVTSGAVYTAINNLTDKYHTGGGWNGLSYTFTGQGGATTFTITIPTGTTANTVAVGNHTHDNYVDLSSDQSIDGVKTFLERPLAKDTYTAIEYLESDAATPFPYIRTGIRRNVQYTDALSCVLDGYFTKTQTLAFNGYDSGGQLGQSSGKWSTESGTSTVSALARTTILQVINFTSNYDRLYQKNNDTYTQIATRAISSAASYAIQADYPLFVAYNGTYTYKPAALRLYSFKMYKGDYYTSPSTCVLLRNFVPAKDAHDVTGLLDLVENKFYPSESAGEFIVGEATGNSYELSTQLLTSGDVAAVALTNSYNSLDDKPNIPSVSNSTITITQVGSPGSSTTHTFTLNGSAKTINLGYTISAADVDGSIKIQPTGGTAYTVAVPGLQAGAFTGVTTTVASGNSNLVTSDAVWQAIDVLPEPMVFKGTLGTGGSITELPTPVPGPQGNEGHTYKVITAGTYASQAAKVGDVFTSTGSAWVLIPSGDETVDDTWREIKVNGTPFLTNGLSSGAVNFTHGANVTISTGSNGAITIAATDTTYGNASTETAGLMSTAMYSKLAGIATGAEVNVQSDWAETDTADDAYIQNKPYLGQQIIVLEDNGSTTAGTWLAKTDAITALAAGQIFLYKVTVAGAATTKLNITCSGTATGAKTIYRMGSTKLTTHYIVGEYILLYFDGTYFKVVNDYDANSDSKVRQYQKGGISTLTGDKYPLLAKYVNASTTSYVASYANYWNDTYLDADTGDLYMNSKKVAVVDDIKDGTLTIQQNGATIATFSANQATAITANITVPTTLDDIADGSSRKLADYLLKTATAKDSEKLDGHDSTYFQTALSAQTAYSAQGSATKVPQITTNNLGQVTGITEITITDHNDNQTVKVGSTTFTANAAVSFTGSGAASVSANNSSNTITITATDTNYYHSTGTWNGLTYTATNNGGAPALAFTIPTGTTANTVAVGNHTHGYYTKPTGGIPGSDLADNYYLASNPSGFTSNEGTVKSVRVQAGTGLSSSTDTAQSTTLNTTISIASGYKLPTTTEWNLKANTSALTYYLKQGSQGEYYVGFDQDHFNIGLEDPDEQANLMDYGFYDSDTPGTGFVIHNQDGDEVSFRTAGFDFTPYGGTTTTISYSNIATKNDLSDFLVETTYSALKTLRNNSQLIPGQQYRITDYQCTTIQADTSSANHQFDIIVTADSTNKLNEKARACLHAGNTYFAASKLEAWELWYSLDNDADRFMWADSTNGKGVIFRMVDEFGNDVPYDFKNILFKRYKISACEKVPDLVDWYLGIQNISHYTTDVEDFIWCYTFTWINENNEIEDCSIVGQTIPSDEQQYPGVFGNIIKACSAECFYPEEPESAGFALNDIVIQATYEDEGGTSYGTYGNTFGHNCYSNTLGGNGCYNNTFGNNCSSNTFGSDCTCNTFHHNCYNNCLGSGCGNNIVEDSFDDNIIDSSFSSNTIGNNFSSNIIGRGSTYNIFGNSTHHNTFGNYCNYNIFGNNCSNNTFGSNCSNNTFGSNCAYNQFGNASYAVGYCQYIIIDNGCKYLYITSTDYAATPTNYLQNIHIHLGVQGNSSNRKTITIPDRNLSYETNVYMDANGNIEQVINSGIVSAINSNY